MYTFLSSHLEFTVFCVSFMLHFFAAALPDITTEDITEDHEFLLLACDGGSVRLSVFVPLPA